ncbi:hypothetical protein ACFLWD_01270 [Chloroflexota bacterium]
MRKLSKTAWTVLVIGFFLILIIGMMMTHSQQIQEQGQISRKLSLAELKLTTYSPEKLSAQQEVLEGEIAWLESQISATKINLHQSAESIEATNTLFEAAEATDTEITEISSGGLTSESLVGVTCSVLSVTVKVDGEVSDLIKFTLKLSREFTTSIVRSVEIFVPEVIEEQGEAEQTWAEIDLSIYAYEYE